MQWFLDISTRSKLVLSFVAMIALLIAVSLAGYRGVAGLRAAQDALHEQEFATVLELKDARMHQYAIRANIAMLMLTSDPTQRESLLKDTERRSQTSAEHLQRLLTRNRGNPQRIAQLQAFEELRLAFADSRNQVVLPLILAGDIDQARALITGVQAERNERMGVIAQALVADSEAAAAAGVAASRELAEETQRYLLLFGILAIVLGLGLAFMLTRLLATPLSTLTVLAERTAEGDLTGSLATRPRRDEAGRLEQAIGHMLASLRALLQELGEGIQVLATAAIEISASTSQVAAGSSETAAAVAQTATTVEQLKQTAQLSAQKARLVSDTAQRTLQISQDGRTATNESIDAMHRIQEEMGSMAEHMLRLAEQGQAIGEIISTVNELAEQSNLLAVNAAIEAARAGEHGKGFSVVAQEVKSLAEQSKQATAQVRRILGELQKATASAAQATEQGNRAVDTGARCSSAVGEAISALTDSIAEAAQAAVQISASAQQQMIGMDQVSLAMQNISQASMQNVASTRQSESAAQNLQGLGAKLKRRLESFRV